MHGKVKRREGGRDGLDLVCKCICVREHVVEEG